MSQSFPLSPMFCSISGSAPEKPVVSTKSGHIFEASAIEKYLEATGKCPVTGEPLEAADLMPLKTTTAVKPRPMAATSIPGMLSLFQNEWDALMLETFTVKQQLETVRQELGHALYQHDAACRVIARLIKERDDARAALAEARPAAPAATSDPAAPPAAQAPAAMEVEAGAGLAPEVTATFDATAKSLSKGRKKRQPPAGYASVEQISAYTPKGASAVQAAGAVCVDAHATSPLLATGGSDGRIVLSSVKEGALTTEATIAGHTGGITTVKLHPTQ